jgi:hypothetical protein
VNIHPVPENRSRRGGRNQRRILPAELAKNGLITLMSTFELNLEFAVETTIGRGAQERPTKF